MKFDVIVSTGVIEHVNNPDEFLKKNGKDYYAEQEMFELYQDVKEDIDFIENFMPEYGKNTLKV